MYRTPARSLGALPAAVGGPYPHLGPIAAALGASHLGALELHADFQDFRVVFALELDSGVVRGLTLEVASGPYPDVSLRAETEADRAGNEAGINREVQVGEALFDHRVYIDSVASDAAVNALLMRPDTRSTVLALLDHGCRTLTFSPRGVLVHWATESGKPEALLFDPAVLRLRLDLAIALARGLPLGDVRGGPERQGEWRVPLAGAGIVVGLGMLVLSLYYFKPADLQLPLFGCLGALAAWFVARPLVARIVCGDSRSFARSKRAVFLLFFDALCYGAGAPILVNGAFDGRGAIERVGQVSKIVQYDEEEKSTVAEVTWPDGPTRSFSFHDQERSLALGDRVISRTHKGALGSAWVESQPTVKRGGPAE